MNKRGDGGFTEKEYLEQVERQTGKRPDGLDPPVDFPEVAIYIWSAFLSLSRVRTNGFSGPNPINFQDIKSYMEVTNVVLSALDVEAILALDSIYMRVTYE